MADADQAPSPTADSRVSGDTDILRLPDVKRDIELGKTEPAGDVDGSGAGSSTKPATRKPGNRDDDRLSNLLTHEPTYFYDPKNFVRQYVDDGVRGKIIDGKALADRMRKAISERIASYSHRQILADGVESCASPPRAPGLTVILVGEDPASKVYVSRKQKACAEVGIRSTLLRLDPATSPQELLTTIERLNEDENCDGILLQLPLPSAELHEVQGELLRKIDPAKDVDGFHPTNLGNLITREPGLRPCTPFGVMHLLWSTGVNPYGLKVLVVGVSNHVGRPMIMELLLNGCSVTVAHRFTKPEDLETFVRDAECVIVAVGKPGIVRGEWIRDGAIVIDIGINRLPSGKLCGDVEFDVAKTRAGWITPVPGGVGPMTVAMLLRNTLMSYEQRNGLSSTSGGGAEEAKKHVYIADV